MVNNGEVTYCKRKENVIGDISNIEEQGDICLHPHLLASCAFMLKIIKQKNYFKFR